MIFYGWSQWLELEFFQCFGDVIRVMGRGLASFKRLH